MSEEITNGEILLLYEAKLTNPNGDPDEENRPRIDPKTNINLVTDVRLKRYFRDYVIEKFGEDYIWVSTIGGKHVDATDRHKKLEEKNMSPENLIDIRLFGATIPKKKGEGASKGEAISYTGPVQFSWGYSLHPVELVDSSTITSIFSGAVKEYGTFGKDWRLYYSLIAFYGVVSGMRAKYTKLKAKDLKILDDFLWKALKVMTTTRSKIGQRPLLYVRINYSDKETLLGDLRDYIDIETGEKIRSLDDIKLSYKRLIDVLQSVKDRIKEILIREENIPWKEGKSLKKSLVEIFGEDNVKDVEDMSSITTEDLTKPSEN